MNKLLEIMLIGAGLKKILVASLGFIIGYFAPVSKFLVITCVLVATDIITGIKAAKCRKEVISSKRMKRKGMDVVWYMGAILLSHLFEDVFFKGDVLKHVPVTFTIAFYISVVEFKSNMENISDITGNDLWRQISNKLTGLTNYNPFKPEKKEQDENTKP